MSYFYICIMTYIDQIQPPPSPSLISYNHDSLFYFLLDFFFPLSSPSRFPPFTFLPHREHDTSDHWCLIYFIYHNVLQFHAFFCNGSPLFFTDRLYSFVYIVYICYTFIIHSSADCYLVVLCLTSESTVAIKLGVQMSPRMPNSFPLGIHLKEGYLNHIYGKSVLSFAKKNPYCFP